MPPWRLLLRIEEDEEFEGGWGVCGADGGLLNGLDWGSVTMDCVVVVVGVECCVDCCIPPIRMGGITGCAGCEDVVVVLVVAANVAGGAYIQDVYVLIAKRHSFLEQTK